MTDDHERGERERPVEYLAEDPVEDPSRPGSGSRPGTVVRTLAIGLPGMLAASLATYGLILVAPRVGVALWVTALFLFVTLRHRHRSHRVFGWLDATFRLRGTSVPASSLMGAAVGTVCLLLAASYFADLAGLPGPEPGASETEALAATGAFGLAAAAFGVAVLGPLVEEILFRGFIQRRFETVAPPGAAIVATALLFGFFHMGAGLALGSIALLLGLVAGALAHRTDSVLPATLVHAAWNGTLVVLNAVPQAPMVRHVLGLPFPNAVLLGVGVLLLAGAAHRI